MAVEKYEGSDPKTHVRLGTAQEQLRNHVETHGRTERIPLERAHGRVLAESVVASRNVPHYRRAAMDGYAVRARDTATATEVVPEECDSTHLDAVARAHDRMDELIDDLLTLARHGVELSDIESVDLMSLTENCWQNVATDGATLNADVTREIRADKSRLQQLLENLFRNAVEHGGSDVTVSVGESDGGFYVEDDGSGIPIDERDVVFEAGYSTAEDGTGFGLSIVKQVADVHGWDIHVTDGSDGGARFEITGVTSAAE